jgi:hypothetical protein
MTSRVEAEKAYTIDEAAEVKSVSPGYIRAAARSNGLPDKKGRVVPPLATKKVGGTYRISASALDAWFAALPDG